MNTAPGIPLLTRFEMQHIPEPNSGCWLWLGATSPSGYGNIYAFGSSLRAHRASWVIFRGAIPAGMHVLHKCDTPSCVNPDHLFLGSHADNMADKVRKGRGVPPPVGRKTHCIRGHELIGPNVRLSTDRRVCRACALIRNRAIRTRKLQSNQEESAA
jgi:hypothetical protein